MEITFFDRKDKTKTKKVCISCILNEFYKKHKKQKEKKIFEKELLLFMKKNYGRFEVLNHRIWKTIYHWDKFFNRNKTKK